MIEFLKPTKFPSEILDAPNLFIKPGPHVTAASSLLDFSKDYRYLVENGTPLLFVGAFKPTYFSPYMELWMYGTLHLKARHAREMRPKFNQWLNSQSLRVVARCTSHPQTVRFLEFLGFNFLENVDGTLMYEAQR